MNKITTPRYYTVQSTAGAEPGPRYTLRAVGTDAVTEDGVERVMHGSNLDDLIVLAILSRFTCEIVDNATGQIVAQNGEAV